MDTPSLLVLAAGIGSRYGGLKQIDPVGPDGEIIIDYSIYDAVRAGFGKVVFVIRQDIERDFRQAIGDRISDRIEVDYAYQELENLPAGYAVPEGRVKPWGTAHAVLSAQNQINGPFGVINADDFYGASGYRLMHDFLASPADVPRHALISFILNNTLSEHGSVARGVCRVSREGFLEKVTEHLAIAHHEGAVVDHNTGTAFTGDEQVSMNMWGFGADFFTVLESEFKAFLDEKRTQPGSEFLIPDVVDKKIQSGDQRIEVLPSRDNWFGVTYPDDKPEVVKRISQLIHQGRYNTPLWDGS
jgi:dTDP-glucose pyrophosphorylase